MAGPGPDTVYVVKTIVDSTLISGLSVGPGPYWGCLTGLVALIAAVVASAATLIVASYQARHAYLRELATRRFDYAERILRSYHGRYQAVLRIFMENNAFADRLADGSKTQLDYLQEMKGKFGGQLTSYHRWADRFWPMMWLLPAFGRQVSQRCGQLTDKLDGMVGILKANYESLEEAARGGGKSTWERIEDRGKELSDDWVALSQALWDAVRRPPKGRKGGEW